MKDLITTVASILILMMFLMQFAANQTTYTRIMGAEHGIKEFRLISQAQGTIREEDVSELKENLAHILNCSSSEITVKVSKDSENPADGEENGEEGGRTIMADYSVIMPIYGIVGPAGILGLSQGDNVKYHTSQGVIAMNPAGSGNNTESEVLP